ncbi:MAG: hypothetical protein RL095_1796 [Verrucomicrobiota bacterium]|jgi:2-keto-4-pentenoate hydratase/2-oxohepta-3-ene-1,7-dioic acid hydratase in catechol pathway
MKLIRFGKAGAEKCGVIHQGQRLDVSAFASNYDEAFFADGGIKKLATWLKKNAASCPVVPERTRLGSCVARPSKIICIGLNYRKHALETNAPIPKEPIVFFKATSALTGPNDGLTIPKNSVKSDWEVELAIVIGKKTQYVSEKDALSHVAGYCVHNDYSEREWQIERGGQWVKGKSADTFAPIGPWLVTADEVKDPQNLLLWLEVNGERVQNSNTSDMIFNCAHIVSYLSQFMTLLPGDVITTGTPEGVGLGFKPVPRFIKPGDVIELGIEGLGTQKQKASAWKAEGKAAKAKTPAAKAAPKVGKIAVKKTSKKK